MKGLTYHRNKSNGFLVVRLHYTAHPKRDVVWKKEAGKGMSRAAWDREYEIQFSTYSGGAVFKEWESNEHCKEIPFLPELPVIRGWDFGYHHPAVVFCQKSDKDILYVGDVMLGRDIGVKQFGTRVKEYCEKEYPNIYFEDYGDPAGKSVSDTSAGKSAIRILSGLGIHVRSRKSSIKEGIEILRNMLVRRNDGKFSMYISSASACNFLVEAFEGGYRYGTSDKEEPEKDGFYDHIMDALRYIVINKFRYFSGEENKNEEEKSSWDTERNSVTGW